MAGLTAADLIEELRKVPGETRVELVIHLPAARPTVDKPRPLSPWFCIFATDATVGFMPSSQTVRDADGPNGAHHVAVNGSLAAWPAGIEL